MGVCQSQLDRQTGNVGLGLDADANTNANVNANVNADNVEKNQNHHLHLPIKATPSRSAYDLAVISPSDKTDITQAISPSSQIASPFSTSHRTNGKQFFLEEDNDEFPSDEEFEDQNSVKSIQVTFREPINHTGGMLNNDIEVEAYSCSPPSIINDDCHLGSQIASKPDPPLLAPPKDLVASTFESPVPRSLTTKTSVNPLTIATFNKIKTQAQQAQTFQKQRRQEAKILDRRRDIQGYKELWGEYKDIIRQQANQQQEEVKASPVMGRENISLNDTTTWYVDFSTLNSMNHLDDQEIEDKEILNEGDQKSQTSLSLLAESTFNSQRKLFQQKTAQRRENMCAYSIGSKKGDTILLDYSEHHSITAPTIFSDNNINVDEDGEQGNKSIIINDNSSIISDLGNGSDVGVDKNDDYGVGILHRYSCKSIETSVPDHYHDLDRDINYPKGPNNIESRVDDSGIFNLDGCNTQLAGLQLPPRKENCATLSTSSYLEENVLPSVSIENAESGLIRWRIFPKTDQKVKVARKIDFSGDKKTSISSQRASRPNVIGTGPDCSLIEETIVEQKVEASDVTVGSLCGSDDELVENSVEMSSSCEGSMNLVEDNKDVKLVRKIGPQLHDLVAQLKENGLGE